MLAFNENGKLTEYEETNFLKVCDSCHHIYKQRVEQQLEGMVIFRSGGRISNVKINLR